MRKINFCIEDNCYILIEGVSIDLHNDFDFLGSDYNAVLNQVSINWVKSKGDWIASSLPNNVQLVFDNISLYKVDCSNLVHDHNDNSTLAFVGYLHPEDVNVMDACLDEKEASEDYHMIFAFENKLAIKVFSDKVGCFLDCACVL